MTHTVRFSRMNDLEDLEVLASETPDHSINTKETRRSSLFLTLLYASFASVILLTSTLLVAYFTTFVSDETFTYHKKSLTEAVDEVIISVSKAENMNCSDHESCDDLRRRIERHDGLKYNFVIGSDMELFVGSGFKHYSHAINGKPVLRVKAVFNEINVNETSDSCWCMQDTDNGINFNRILLRMSEIVQQGLVCGTIKNSTKLSFVCGDKTEGCYKHTVSNNQSIFDSVRNPKHDSIINNEAIRRHEHYDPDPELGTILSNDFRLLSCERPKGRRRTVISKVITLKSFEAVPCEPFTPVDRVRVDFVNTSRIPCLDDECTDISRLLERDHDADNYNFVLDTYGYLYIGRGFSCRVTSSDNATEPFRIKILRSAGMGIEDRAHLLLQLRRLYGIIKEGRRCGWIASNYSLEIDCECDLKDYISFMDSLGDTFHIGILIKDNRNKKGFETIDHTHRGKIIDGLYLWTMCNQTVKAKEANIQQRKLYFLRSCTNISYTSNGFGSDFSWHERESSQEPESKSRITDGLSYDVDSSEADDDYNQYY